MNINPKLISIQEEFINDPIITIYIGKDDNLLHECSFSITDDWLKKCKNYLDNNNIFKMSANQVKISLSKYKFNKKIFSFYNLKDSEQLDFQCINLCIRELLKYCRNI